MKWHFSSWEKINSARKNGKLPHALLITGEQGVGKKLFSDQLSQSLLCKSPTNLEACNNCSACKTYLSGAHPDFLEIDLLEDKQQISVDQIRKITTFLNKSRSFDAYKVVLIQNVDRLNLNASNSLLKSLEEPTKQTILILVSSQYSQLLATVKSRCQRLMIPTPSFEDGFEWLNSQSDDNNDEKSKELIKRKLILSSNKPLQALDLTEDDLEQHDDFLNDLILLSKAQINLLHVAKKWEPYEFKTLLDWQLRYLQNNIKSHLTNINYNEINELNDCIDKSSYWHLYKDLLHLKQTVHTSVNTLMSIENMLLLWQQANRPTTE